MAKEILISSKCLQLFIFIIFIFNQITYSSGLNDVKGKFCSSLISTISTNFKCKYNGTHVENCENPRSGTTVLISCIGFNEESSLQENPIRLCMNGEWSSEIPRCYSTPIVGEDIIVARFKPKPDVAQNNSHGSCSSLTSSLSTNVKCVYNNTILKNCQNPPNGTIVIVSCNPFYTRESFEDNSNLVCKNGRWSTSIPECYPSHSQSNLFIGPHNELHRIFCPSLTSSASTNFECKHNGKPREDCLNPVHKTTVLISCNPSYEEASLKINPIRLCQNGKWSSTIPQCYPSNREESTTAYDPSIRDQTSSQRVCPSLTSTASTNFQCIHKGKLLNNCENAINGTLAIISCNNFYEESSLENNPIRICRNDKWSSTIPQCNPICGKVPAKMIGTSRQSVGSKNNLHDYPWHVGIYSTAKKYLCGGTIIIKPKIILTAAHCVTGDDGKIIHPSNYLVAAGKHYRNFTDPRDKYAQYAEVSEIHIPTGYKKSTTAQPLDVAVLVLKEPFTSSIAVQPVCLELNKKSENLNNLVNSTGIVTGWGSIKKGGPRSEILKELILPYVPLSQCYQELQEPWKAFLTNDKICSGYIQNGGVICHGDGGGGFIFKNMVEDRYYIEAVVSLGVFNTFNECYSNQYTAHTSVFYTSQFLKSAITTL